jgi:hypothetical protein
MTIERLEQALAAATPGPWDTSDHREWLTNDKRQRFTALPKYPGRTEEAHIADVDLIVAAVNLLPRFIDVVRAAETLLDDHAKRHGPNGYPTTWPETHRNLAHGLAALDAAIREELPDEH